VTRTRRQGISGLSPGHCLRIGYRCLKGECCLVAIKEQMVATENRVRDELTDASLVKRSELIRRDGEE